MDRTRASSDHNVNVSIRGVIHCSSDPFDLAAWYFFDAADFLFGLCLHFVLLHKVDVH